MKVQFLRSVGAQRFNFRGGKIYDTLLKPDKPGYISESDARYYISKGLAKKVEDEGKAKETRPLKPKSKAKKVSKRPV